MALVVSLALFQCPLIVKEPAPAPWAPVQGAQSKYHYDYYHGSAVYYDTARKLYFYHDGTQWKSTTLLPEGVVVDWKRYVVLDMGTDKPYRYHAEVVKSYPPGRQKKIDKEKKQE